MHRIEGENVDVSTGVNLFKDTPPYTIQTPAWANSVQEEIMNVIISSGQAVLAENSDSRDQLWTAITGLASVPVGAVIPWLTGYYGAPANGGGFTPVTIDLPPNWSICDGSAINDPDSPIFDGAGRFLPDLTDDRFLMGDIAGNMGATGGSNDITAHTATYPNHQHEVGYCDVNNTNIWFYRSNGNVAIKIQVFPDNTITGGAARTYFTDSVGSNEALYSKTDGGGSVTISNNHAGANANLPQYIACRYIIRIK